MTEGQGVSKVSREEMVDIECVCDVVIYSAIRDYTRLRKPDKGHWGAFVKHSIIQGGF